MTHTHTHGIHRQTVSLSQLFSVVRLATTSSQDYIYVIISIGKHVAAHKSHESQQTGSPRLKFRPHLCSSEYEIQNPILLHARRVPCHAQLSLSANIDQANCGEIRL